MPWASFSFSNSNSVKHYPWYFINPNPLGPCARNSTEPHKIQHLCTCGVPIGTEPHKIQQAWPVWFWLSGVKCHNVFIVLDEQEPVGELTHESGSTALPQNSTVHGILDQKMSKSPWGNSPTKAVPQHCHKIQHLHKCHTLQYQTTQNYTGSFGPWYWITQNQTTILQHFVRVWYWTTQNQTEPPVWFCVVWGS